jgi:hypothetical protein
MLPTCSCPPPLPCCCCCCCCCRFHLINYRVPMQFLFFRGGLLHPVLSARGPLIEPSNPNQPLQRRLALTGDNT